MVNTQAARLMVWDCSQLAAIKAPAAKTFAVNWSGQLYVIMIPMFKYKVSIETQPDSKQLDFVDKQLHEYNVGKIGDYQYTPLFLFLRDSEQKVVGGLNGFMGLGWLHISTLWISEELRGFGYGKALLLTAEQEAVRCGCFNSYVFTYSFQAVEFYQHLEYEVFGELEDFPPGYRRYFLQKRLTNPDSKQLD